MATTGCAPEKASPAAIVVACCSAMPTSMIRSGWASAKGWSPTGIIIAAVIATMSLRSAPRASISSLNSSVHERPAISSGRPVSGLILPTAWNWSATSLQAWS